MNKISKYLNAAQKSWHSVMKEIALIRTEEKQSPSQEIFEKIYDEPTFGMWLKLPSHVWTLLYAISTEAKGNKDVCEEVDQILIDTVIGIGRTLKSLKIAGEKLKSEAIQDSITRIEDTLQSIWKVECQKIAQRRVKDLLEYSQYEHSCNHKEDEEVSELMASDPRIPPKVAEALRTAAKERKRVREEESSKKKEPAKRERAVDHDSLVSLILNGIR